MHLDPAILDAAAAERPFSGVVSVHVGGRRVLAKTYGWAHRAFRVPTAVDMQFAIASGSKVFTALLVLRLVEDGALSLETPARDILGVDLPLVDDRVSVGHLVAHTAGIGDYLDEASG